MTGWNRLIISVVSALCAFLACGGVANAAPPSISSQWVTAVTPTDATLHAEINPNGLLTKYKLQIDTTGQFKFFQSDSCPLHPPGVGCAQVIIPGDPLPPGLVEPPEGTLAAGTESRHVSVDLARIGATLQPETTYHFRAIAANGVTVIAGADDTFTTPSAIRSPTIESASVSGIGQHDATLEAEIDPNGLATQYRFHLEYGCGLSAGEACPMYCVVGQPCPGPINGPVDIPLPSGAIPESLETKRVSMDLNEVGVTLLPDTRYRFGIEAVNSKGAARSPDQLFMTLSKHTSPTIDAEGASEITPTDAILEAQINPQSDERGAIYQFQVVSSPGEYLPEFTCPTEGFPAGSSLCLLLESQAGALPIGWSKSGKQDQLVSLDLAAAGMELEPGTTYHYRVIAARSVLTVDTIDWEDPVVYGSDRTFTTSSEPVTEPEVEEEEEEEVRPPGGHVPIPVDLPPLPRTLPPRAQPGGTRAEICGKGPRHGHRRKHPPRSGNNVCLGVAGAFSVAR